LTEVDLIIRVNGPAQTLGCQTGDDLVGVHIAAGARTGLEQVHRKMTIFDAGLHLLRCLGDGTGHVRIQQPQVAVGLRSGSLDFG